MSNSYDIAQKQLKRNPKADYPDRQFKLALLESNNSEFEAKDATMAAVLKHDRNFETETAALRVQVIPDPTRPFGARNRIIQFFVVEGSREGIRERLSAGVIYEVPEGKDDEAGIPLFFLNKADVERTINGEGFASSLPEEA